MITEDYVSFEIAKLLKEKGFDWNCDEYYTKNGSTEYTQLRYNHNDIKNLYSKPTHQTAMKWLREVHNIYIGINPYNSLNTPPGVWYKTQIKASIFNIKDKGLFGDRLIEKDFCEDSYKDAVESALKYALQNLI